MQGMLSHGCRTISRLISITLYYFRVVAQVFALRCRFISRRESRSNCFTAWAAIRSLMASRTGFSDFQFSPSKLKPRWDVHLAGSFAGKLQPWIAGLSGSAVSPRLCGG